MDSSRTLEVDGGMCLMFDHLVFGIWICWMMHNAHVIQFYSIFHCIQTINAIALYVQYVFHILIIIYCELWLSKSKKKNHHILQTDRDKEDPHKQTQIHAHTKNERRHTMAHKRNRIRMRQQNDMNKNGIK